MTFKNDLEKGNLWENVAIIILQNMGFEFINRCYDSRFDIEMAINSISERFEIKTDFMQTDNIVIEYECHGKRSGIAKSEADSWCFIFPHDWQMWIIGENELVDLCFDANKIDGGYKNRSKMYIFNKLDVMHNFKIINYKQIILQAKNISLDLPKFIKKEFV